MRKNKTKLSIYDCIRYASPEELKQRRIQSRMRAILGIYYCLDDVGIKTNNSYIPIMYKSLYEYENDKETAQEYIIRNKEVPKQLFDKLVAARIELEQRGVLEPFNNRVK